MFDKVKYDNNFQKENYDRIALNIPKGKKELLREKASEKGFSNLTSYIISLIEDDIGEHLK